MMAVKVINQMDDAVQKVNVGQVFAKFGTKQFTVNVLRMYTFAMSG